MVWRGPIAQFFVDLTPLIDLEGALNCGKTTGCLWKIHDYCQRFPGIWTYIGRFTQGDTDNKLVPAWAEVCRQGGVLPSWEGKGEYYQWPNGSRTYCFGLKAADSKAGRYSKLRGLGVSVIYIDQAEELPPDFFGELGQRLRQPGFFHQMILSPNPLDENSWLADEFPVDNSKPGRKYYSLSLYDNAHNLPADTVARNESLYPPGHAKHRTMILGRRGLNVIGDPVYAGAFERARHVVPLTCNPDRPLYEAIDFGKHHPCVVWAQRPLYGGLHVLGGLLGQDVWLEDFIPLLMQYRSEWFPDVPEVISCCDPAGSHQNSQGVRDNGVTLLRQHGIVPRWVPNSNAPDVRSNQIERIAAHMRRRTPSGEAFGVDAARWLRISSTKAEHWPFLADGCEAGYVWDVQMVSVGSKKYRKPVKDGWYEHGQNCLEYLELNFGGVRPTAAQQEQAARQHRSAEEWLAGFTTPTPGSNSGWQGA